MNHKTEKISLSFSVALLMFPQVIETMYSPALTSIKAQFGVSTSTAAQALSVFFIAFAFGVIFWGRMCDVIGRRQSMLGGLAVLTIGSCSALIASNFNILLCSFAVCAFGAAVGSICTQTMIRDSYQGKDLAHVFTIAATSIGISPVVGLLLGSWLTAQGGYLWVFATMVAFILVLSIWCFARLPETKPAHTQKDSLISIAIKMSRDSTIWYTVAMISFFNVALFSYYSIAPFMFEDMGLGVDYFGNTGFIIALGSIAGSFINSRLLKMEMSDTNIVRIASLLLLISAVSVYCLQSTQWFFVPMALVSLAFGLAIPHIMGNALVNYRDHLGSAGALLGSFYYLLIGAGLEFANHIGDLGEVLIACSVLAVSLMLLSAAKGALTTKTQLEGMEY
ncbi:putative MFS family arabinose efflux permease [Sinobacterium caligoides]|uniref:Putative MFS family arabinose efflux permease n=1 Tax=Sinobacterium caligoides TaxID=933926 RepID=A0A3N2DKN1_9GAMM|nr:MFS transporter [Sinobacterium caligoides]ROS00262.1 putative MFS family arabinose efflux permease [Sinobacterium caligoides]